MTFNAGLWNTNLDRVEFVFTSKYHTIKLVYFEWGNDVQAAILREKQIKAGSRQKKVDLINQMNPEWKDLFDEIMM